MNKGLIFGLGTALGGGLGTLGTMIVLKRKLNREKEQEIEELRAYYKKKMRELDAKSAEKKPVSKKNEENVEEKEEKSKENLTQKVGLAERNTADLGRQKVHNEHVDYTKYSKIAENYTGEEAKNLFQYPHEITEDEFDNEGGYKKVILTYYECDDIIADVNDQQSEYTVEDFGYENMNDFGFEGIKYLRNDKKEEDYKIIYEPTLSYDEATGGVHLNDP
ncbi:MAG: hypothetical protein J6Y02_02460 [Pseudobutyrivibrio sp.]|nr:hypothetical protein [Pseudobutyrivibrio sp.]